MFKHKPHEYKAIREWGKMMGSYPYYIRMQQELASQEDAPLDAIYRSDKGWECVSGLAEGHHFRIAFEKMGE